MSLLLLLNIENTRHEIFIYLRPSDIINCIVAICSSKLRLSELEKEKYLTIEREIFTDTGEIQKAIKAGNHIVIFGNTLKNILSSFVTKYKAYKNIEVKRHNVCIVVSLQKASIVENMESSIKTFETYIKYIPGNYTSLDPIAKSIVKHRLVPCNYETVTSYRQYTASIKGWYIKNDTVELGINLYINTGEITDIYMLENQVSRVVMRPIINIDIADKLPIESLPIYCSTVSASPNLLRCPTKKKPSKDLDCGIVFEIEKSITTNSIITRYI